MYQKYSPQDVIPKTEQPLHCSFELLLSKKNLNELLFENVPGFNSPIQEHAAWVFEHIYSKSYIKKQTVKQEEIKSEEQIARPVHGMAHICRAAIAVPVWIHLFRRYEDEEALSLTQDDVKLLQIAMLFHDCAREDDGEDLWDHESATFLYYYLIKMGVESELAMYLAEAVANKDAETIYYRLQHIGNELYWVKYDVPERKNIYQKIIHDSDCLDIIRARDHFDARFLDFYKQFVLNNKDKTALEEMAQLICEWRSIILKHGDTRGAIQIEKKLQFERKEGYLASLKTLNDEHYCIVPVLYNNGLLVAYDDLKKDLLPSSFKIAYDPLKGLDESNVEAAFREGKILVRGISYPPSAVNARAFTNAEGNKESISMAKFDILKTARRKGVPTSSSKANRLEKQGFPMRSTSFMFPGASLLSTVGFMIIDPEDEKLSSISKIDNSTGWGKNRRFFDRTPVDRIKEQRETLYKDLKLGGGSTRFNDNILPSTHNECTYDLEKFDAIYFTNDPTRSNEIFFCSVESIHRHSPLLQALFIQKEYELVHHVKLPIFEYSALHSYLKYTPEEDHTEDKIKEMWIEVIVDYINTLQKNCDPIELCKINEFELIKKRAIYGSNIWLDKKLAKDCLPPDYNYEPIFKEELKNELVKKIFLNPPLSTPLSLSSRQVMSLVVRDIVCFLNCAAENKVVEPNALFVAAILGYDIVFKVAAFFKQSIAHLIDNKGNTLLYHAFLNGHYEIFNQLLSMGADLNSPNQDKYTILHLSVSQGDISLVQQLLESGAKVNEMNGFGQTPLYIAVRKGLVNIVKLLLNYGAHAHATQLYQDTPLHVIGNHHDEALIRELVEFLLSHGADINAKSTLKHPLFSKPINQSPLAAAIVFDSYAAVKILLENGAEVTDQDISNARRYGHEKIEEILNVYKAKNEEEQRLTSLNSI